MHKSWLASLVLGLAVACNAFGSSGDDDEPVNPATPPPATGGTNGDLDGAAPSTPDSGSSGTSSTSSGGQACPVPGCAPDALVCDGFERVQPDAPGTGWKFTSPPRIATDFLIRGEARDCRRSLFARVASPGAGKSALQVMSIPITVPNRKVKLAFDFRHAGTSAITGGGRSAYVVATTADTYDIGRPFVALTVKEGQFVLSGANGGQPVISGTVSFPEGEFLSVTMDLSLDGEPSTLDVQRADGSSGTTGPTKLPALHNGQSINIVIGVAAADVDFPGDITSLSAEYDNLSISTP